MSKPKKLGMKSTYIPNAKADMRHHKKVYQRGKEKALLNAREQQRENDSSSENEEADTDE